MAGYISKDELKQEESQTVGADASNTVVSETFKISAADSKNILIKVVASSVTVGTLITAKLRDSFDGAAFEDTDASIAISGNGNFEMDINLDNTTDTMLWPQAQVTITTGSGDAVTVDKVLVSRRL